MRLITKKVGIKWSTLDTVLRESSHVFMAFRERKRHFPSGVWTQRGQFSKSSALFRFMGPAVHPQVSDLSIPAQFFFFTLVIKSGHTEVVKLRFII